MWKSTGLAIARVTATVIFTCLPRTSPAAVDLKTLLQDIADYDTVARWPDPTFSVRQASSYDRARVAPDKPGWFANNDNSNFIRNEQHAGHEERVMLDTDGPGAIVRFFLTTSGSRNAKIHIYLDGADTPTIDWPTLDLTRGDLKLSEPLQASHPPPRGHGGSTLYLPIPYARHCKVTLEELDPAHAGARYYHIDYRTYAPGTDVHSFTLAQLDTARPAIETVNKSLADPPTPVTTAAATTQATLEAAEEKSVDLPSGSNAVRQLELSVATGLPPAAREQALRSVVLRAEFDEAETVWCPVGDFVGSGTGGKPLSSWYRTVDEQGNAVCRWTMPYKSKGKISLLNLGNQPVAIKLVARTGQWTWDDRSMYFHCNWHQQVQIPVRPFRDWNFLTVTGRGALVGDVMSVFNPEPAWYGEGNEKIWVDGESFPSHVGTGTEDYYNASWAPNPTNYQTPFANHPRIDEPHGQGHNVYTRSRNLDAIPFNSSLKFDFEIETWRENYAVDYAATTYWYGSPGARASLASQAAEARRPISVLPAVMALQGAIECENLHVVARSAGLKVETQDMRPFAGQWSGNAQLLIRGSKEGDFVELAIPVESTAPQRVTLYATQAKDYGILKFSVNGQPVDDTFDGYTPDPKPSGPITLGIFTPKDGKLVLRVEITGCNAKAVAAKYLAGLDAVVISQ